MFEKELLNPQSKGSEQVLIETFEKGFWLFFL
jgi:hypothetical protein